MRAATKLTPRVPTVTRYVILVAPQQGGTHDQVWIDLLVSWLPFLFLILVLIGTARMFQRRSRAPSGRTIAELCELQLEEMKRHTTALERIAQALENRGRA
jgi:hypothetical protein